MRIGSSILIRDSKAIQSYNWNLTRPLGNLQDVMRSLDRFETDEVCIMRYSRGLEDECQVQKDLIKLETLKSMTPISLGGGISPSFLPNLIGNLPIERLVFSSEFIIRNSDVIEIAKEKMGRQAIQCLLPLISINNSVSAFHCKSQKFLDINQINFNRIDSLSNEVIIYDMQNEGNIDEFNFSLLKPIPIKESKIVITGGIGLQTIKKAHQRGFAGVLIENHTLHSEDSIRRIKNDSLR